MIFEEIRFGELYKSPSSNGVSRPSSVRGSGFKMINMGELFSNDIINDMKMELVELSQKEQEKFFVTRNDLLFARQSLVASGAGKCSIINEIPEKTTTFESHLIRVRLDQDKADPWYYFYLFKLSYNPIKTIVNQCAQAGIRGTDLVKIKVPYPSCKYQKLVASVLRKYDILIENNNKRIKILEQMVEKMYKEVFSRKNFDLIDINKSNIGNDYTYVKISEVMTFDRGISYSSDEINCDEGLYLVNLKNIDSYGGFRRDGYKQYNGKYKSSHEVNEGDLVMGITDMTQDRRTVGHVALIPSLNRLAVISADLVRIDSKLNNIYLYCLFKYGGISKYISQFANGSNVLHLRPSMIKNIKIPIANENLVSKFVSLVTPIYQQIEILNIKNDNLIKQRDLLLPRLMSGKIELN